MAESVLKILLGFFIACIFLGVYVRHLETVNLFHPSRDVTVTPKEAGMDFEDIYFSTEDHVRLNGWLVKTPVHPEQAATLLFCHGNAGNNSYRVEKIAAFHELGVNVFIFDYRGFGKSQGRPSEKGMYTDTVSAYDYLQGRKDIAKERIFVYGASMGGVAAVDLASRRPVTALIADSTFTSAKDMARVIAPFVPTFIMKTRLDNAQKITGIKVPKLFIHSPDDATVPFYLGKKLFEMASEPKEFLKTSGSHGEGFSLSKDISLKGIKDFLDKYHLR